MAYRGGLRRRALTAAALAVLIFTGLPVAAHAVTASPQGDTISDAASTGKTVEIQSATRSTDPTTLTITITTYSAFTDTAAAFFVFLDTQLAGQADYEIPIFAGLSGPSATTMEGGLSPRTGHVLKATVTRPTTSSVAVSFPRSWIGGSTTFDWFVAALDLSSSTPSFDIAPDHPTVVASRVARVAGTDRIATAIQSSFFFDGTAGGVVLARADDFPDALAGAPLANAKKAPLLLTDTATLDPRVLAEIQRVLPAGGTVYLLGGLTALSQAVEDAITTAGFQAVRFNGADRYDTALQVATKGLNDPSVIFLTTGLKFADALSAGSAAVAKSGALLLTSDATMPPSVKAYLTAHPSDALFAVGGPAATAEPTATGVSGADRYETAKKVAQTFFTTPRVIGVANGTNFPDALAGGATLAEAGGPLLLTAPDMLSTPTHDYLVAEATSKPFVLVFGGPLAVSDAAVAQIKTALGF